MDYVDRAFVDEVVHLDGNTFTRCSFEGCVLRYDGGDTGFVERTSLKTENSLQFGPTVDAHSNAVSQWLIASTLKLGDTVTGDPNAAKNPRVTPKKDLG